MMNKTLLCLMAILNMTSANNYLLNMLQLMDHEANRPEGKHTTEPRCVLFLGSGIGLGRPNHIIRHMTVDLNSPVNIKHDKDLGVLKMIIDDKIGFVLHEIENVKRRTRVEGIYYNPDGNWGDVNGVCIW